MAVMRDVLKSDSPYVEYGMRVLDLSALLLAGHVATYCRFHTGLSDVEPVHGVMLYFCAALAFLVFPQCDLYVSWRGRSPLSLGVRLAMSWSLVLLAGLVFSFLIHHVGDLSRLWMLYWYLAGLCLLMTARACLYLLLRRLRAQGFNNRRVLIVGDNPVAHELHARARQQAWYGYEVVGVHPGCANVPSNAFDAAAGASAAAVMPGAPPTDLLSTMSEAAAAQSVALADIADFVALHRIDELWVTLPMAAAPELQALHHLLRSVLADVRWIPDTLSMQAMSLQMIDFLGFPALDLNAPVSRGVPAVVKILFDKLFSAMVLVLLSPLLVAIAAGIKLTSPGPVLFKQSRLGLNGRKFDVYKFRTMAVHHEPGVVTQARRGDQRVTPFGAFLRRRSLDELPQFFNVLLGDMSVVGPRPHALAHNEFYKALLERYMLRHRVRPGITGWAQIHGYRGETDTVDKMAKRVQFDLYYIQNWSLWMDVRIVLRTALGGWSGNNVY
jgi:putative colanic acid biosynthesis UDP-glucose lipid carrier transferase